MAPVAGVQAPAAALPAAGEAPMASGDVVGLAGLLEISARSLRRLDKAADKAADGSMYAQLAAVSGQLHKAIEAAAKLQGLYSESAPGGPSLSVTFNLPAPHAAGHDMRNITPSASSNERPTITMALGAPRDTLNGACSGVEVAADDLPPKPPGFKMPDFELTHDLIGAPLDPT